VHLHAEEDDAVLEELGVRVLALVAVGGALLERGQDVPGGRALRGDAAGHLAGRGGAVGGEAGAAEDGEVHADSLGGRGAQDVEDSSDDVPPSPVTAAALETTWSMNPYSRDSAAVNQRSRSASELIRSSGWPVCS